MRALALIPAHNEAGSLSAVVAELRASRSDLDILIVDDGSTDETPGVVRRLDVRWLRFSERLGIGSAVRAGLRYAAQRQYDIVVRLDGDGQHSAADIDSLLAPASPVATGARTDFTKKRTSGACSMDSVRGRSCCSARRWARRSRCRLRRAMRASQRS